MNRNNIDRGGGTSTPLPSYASRVKKSKFELLNRNILEVIVEKKIKNQFVNLNGDAVARICHVIGIKPECDTEGYQVHYRGGYISVALWVKEAVGLEKFVSEEAREVGEDLLVTQVRPAMRREVSALITGLPFNIPDNQVIHYIECFLRKSGQ